MSTAFCDTNILVYAFAEISDVRKQEVALKLVDRLLAEGSLSVSAQVLSEFYWVATMKLRPRMPAEEAQAVLRRFTQARILALTAPLVLAATERSQKSLLSYWDSLILEAAIASGSEILYSEDMQHGAVFDSVRIVNPFV